MDFDVESSAECYYTVAFSDVFSRAIFPYILPSSQFSSLNVFLFGVAGISLLKILLLYLRMQYATLILISFTLGIFKSLTVVNQVLIVDDFCKKFCPRKLPGMLGLSYVIKSLCLFILQVTFDSFPSISVNGSIHIYCQIVLQCIVMTIWFLVL